MDFKTIPLGMTLHPDDSVALNAKLHPLLEEYYELEKERPVYSLLVLGPNPETRDAFDAAILRERELQDRVIKLRAQASRIADNFVPAHPLVSLTDPNHRL